MKKSPEFNPCQVSACLLAWYGHQGRDLPWRRTRDPYCIWLSEVMLQQTTVAAVIPYYQRFLARFADVRALAEAPLDEVISLWAGLGYYSRARNLHAAAQMVVARFAGDFPAELEDLKSLPGVGRSTAGAILSIAFDRKAPILDGNVRRVLCRLYALSGDPRSTVVEKELWRRAEELTPEDRPHDYAQAIMDLGATVCTPRSPSCGDCPLEGLCQARARGLENVLPERRSRKTPPTRVQVALLLERDGRILLQRRPYEGLLGGLWEFPCAPAEARNPSAAAERLLDELGLAGRLRSAGQIAHAYSHFRLDLHLFAGRVEGVGRVAEDDASCWVAAAELAELPLHGAHKKALGHLGAISQVFF